MILFLEKLKSTSPANHELAVCIDCLDPSLITGDVDKAKEHFENALNCLEEATLLTADLDTAKRQFDTFVRNNKNNEKFKNFNFTKAEDRVDTLFYNALHDDKESKELWSVVKLLLVLSHGQASVERGFSINKYASTTNQSEDSLVARRIVRDHLNYLDHGLDKFTVSEDLFRDVKASRKRYFDDLAVKKRMKKCRTKKHRETNYRK